MRISDWSSDVCSSDLSTDVWLYSADRWGVDQADDYVGQIEDNLRKAAAGLRIAQPIDELWKIRSGHHLCLFAKEADDVIWVIRILHERRSEEHTSELQSLMRISYAVFCLTTKRYSNELEKPHEKDN